MLHCVHQLVAVFVRHLCGGGQIGQQLVYQRKLLPVVFLEAEEKDVTEQGKK